MYCSGINSMHCVCVKEPPCGFHTQHIALRINATQGNIRNADSEFKYNHLHGKLFLRTHTQV